MRRRSAKTQRQEHGSEIHPSKTSVIDPEVGGVQSTTKTPPGSQPILHDKNDVNTAPRTPLSSSRLVSGGGRKILAAIGGLFVMCFLFIVMVNGELFLPSSGGARFFLSTSTRNMQVSTFNVAAINNNPFEYWLTMPENPKYEDLMSKIEDFIENPGDKDIPVSEVFTQDMFKELDQRLTSFGWTSVKSYWESDFSKRQIVAGFLKDGALGKKRLASMPDRVTNVITTADGKSVFRPTVISMYEEDLGTQEKWWKAWQTFMFDQKLKIKNKDGKVEERAPWSLLKKINRAKYQAVSEQEEEDSLPLQTLCGAIFDGILVHMMNKVSPPDVWQQLKRTIVENLNKKKVRRTLEILESQYMDSDILTLQEVSSTLVEGARKGELGKKYHIITPANLDPVRDQNSIIFLSKLRFPAGSKKEITDVVESMFPKGEKVPVADGDILAIVTKDASGQDFVIASFHGDTNGLASIPVLDALVAAKKTSKSVPSNARLVFGLDANTYEQGVPGDKQDVMEWGTQYVKHGLTSCWGDVPQKSNYTTYNARTYLQPQLNKACKQTEKRKHGDVNPKDFILFAKNDYRVVRTWKDNTGQREYKEDMAFPTMQFPSDHGILTTILESIEEDKK